MRAWHFRKAEPAAARAGISSARPPSQPRAIRSSIISRCAGDAVQRQMGGADVDREDPRPSTATASTRSDGRSDAAARQAGVPVVQATMGIVQTWAPTSPTSSACAIGCRRRWIKRCRHCSTI